MDGSDKNEEIERRWLVKCLPEDYARHRHTIINQGYLDDKTNTRFRVESDDNNSCYFRTVKTGQGRNRDEDEITLSREEFLLYWSQVVWVLAKKRYFIPYGSFTLELNIFLGKLFPYVHVEVPFTCDEDADRFVAPVWFDREVTNDCHHTSYYLARYGLPTEE